MIDLTKKYKTVKGYDVENLRLNCSSGFTTFLATVNGHELLYSDQGLVCGWMADFNIKDGPDYVIAGIPRQRTIQEIKDALDSCKKAQETNDVKLCPIWPEDDGFSVM